MNYKAPSRCPVCGHELTISSVACGHCQTKIEGKFTTCVFCKLPPEQLEFVEVFVKCRGNIKDVEKELGISYPTVRGRLESVIQALGYNPDRNAVPEKDQEERRQEILQAVESGEMTAQEAIKQLKETGRPIKRPR